MHHFRDVDGNVVSTLTEPLKVEVHATDAAQLAAGACVMALPVSLTEEVWNLGAELSLGRTLGTLAYSLLALSGLIWALFYGKRVVNYWGDFFRRVLTAYLVTFLVALTLLILFDKAPLSDLSLTLTPTILVAFPASFAAAAVDFMKSTWIRCRKIQGGPDPGA